MKAKGDERTALMDEVTEVSMQETMLGMDNDQFRCMQEMKCEAGRSVVFVAGNRVLVLKGSSNQALVENPHNNVVKKSTLPIPNAVILYVRIEN